MLLSTLPLALPQPINICFILPLPQFINHHWPTLSISCCHIAEQWRDKEGALSHLPSDGVTSSLPSPSSVYAASNGKKSDTNVSINNKVCVYLKQMPISWRNLTAGDGGSMMREQIVPVSVKWTNLWRYVWEHWMSWITVNVIEAFRFYKTKG